jgi:hypothetical protein
MAFTQNFLQTQKSISIPLKRLLEKSKRDNKNFTAYQLTKHLK